MQAEGLSDIDLATKLVNLDPQQAAAAIRKHREDAQAARLEEIRARWENRLVGRIVLLFVVLSVSVSIVVFFLASEPEIFDDIAKTAVLLLTVVPAMTLLKGDPFHADVDKRAGYLDRLKPHGKIVATLFVFGLVFGLLGLCTASRVHSRELRLLEKAQRTADEIDETSKSVQKTADETLRSLADLNNKAIALVRQIPGKEALVSMLEDSAWGKAIITTRTLASTLKGSDWGRTLVTTTSLPDALRDSTWGQTLITTSTLAASLQGSDWGKALVTTATLADTLRSSEWGKTLVTSASVSDALKNSDWGKTLITTATLPGALKDSDWGKTLATTETLPDTLQKSDWGKTLVTTATLLSTLESSNWGRGLVRVVDLEDALRRVLRETCGGQGCKEPQKLGDTGKAKEDGIQ